MTTEIQTRRCSICKQHFPLTSEHFYKYTADQFGFQKSCKLCLRMYSVHQNQDRTRSHRKRLAMASHKYGLTQQQISSLLDANKECGICEREFTINRKQCIDHDHETKKVRGILCSRCNLVLGHYGDSLRSLKVAKKFKLGRQAGHRFLTSDKDGGLQKAINYLSRTEVPGLN